MKYFYQGKKINFGIWTGKTWSKYKVPKNVYPI